jgi:hypothetical protein
MEQPNNLNYTYLPEKHTTIVKKPIIIDNTKDYYRHTLQPGVNQQKLNNQNVQNVQNVHMPHTHVNNPYPYNIQNANVDDKRKTFTHPPKKPEQFTEQIIGNEIIEETYYIDPQTGKKKIIPNDNKQKTNNQAIYNIKIPQNEAYYMGLEKGIVRAKPPQHQDNTKLRAHQPPQQPQQPQQPQTINDNTYNINPTASVYTDIYSSVDPSNNKEEKISPVIENINPSDHLKDGNDLNLKKSATLMTVKSLANIPYDEYPTAEYSKEAFCNISAYGYNSYNGKVKKYNEDRIKIIVDYQLSNNNAQPKSNISYFGIFDGHSGNKCSDFLKANLHTYLFNSPYFPHNPIRAIKESFKKAEDTFLSMVYDAKNNKLKDKSGSCALVMLIINDILVSINLGDSRALYSYDTGKYLFQITRDHKPNDDVEKKRIEGAGGKVYYANKVHRKGREIELKEEQFGKGFSFPHRISPGGIAVSLLFYILK